MSCDCLARSKGRHDVRARGNRRRLKAARGGGGGDRRARSQAFNEAVVSGK